MVMSWGFGSFRNEVGNVWEWTSDPFPGRRELVTFRWLSHLGTPVRPDEEEKWTLKGGSFLDSATGDFNHKAGYTATPALILGRVRRNLEPSAAK